MNVKRVAVIFDNTARPETTGVYCRRALGQLVEVEHFLPTELSRLPRGKFDLYLFIDDGFNYPIPAGLGPTAYWAIDTHLDFDRAAHRASQVDFLFAAQRDGADQLKQAGFAANWLPLACDPELHGRQSIPLQFDWSFVGNLFPGARSELIDLLRRKFPNCFVGQGRFFEAMASVYSASRIVFNRSLKNDVNMRVFEGLVSGSLLLTNDLADNGQSELFQDGIHLVTYRDSDELIERARYYLAHEALRQKIAAAGCAAVMNEHTYLQRMRTILETIERQSHVNQAVPDMVVENCSDQEQLGLRQLPVKDGSYFDFPRPEVAALVPPTARRILDIGCGSGRLGESLKRRQKTEVVGIELNPQAAATARARLDEVLVANVESPEVEFPDGRFDCIICADILEHLREPAIVLRKLRRWLTHDGTLVASIPNVGNQAVVRSLLDGNWTYESAGLLDSDHVRFFTRREVEKLFFRAGLRIGCLQFVSGEGFDEWERAGRSKQLDLGALQIRCQSTEEAAEWFAYQFLIAAQPEPTVESDLTSIVIVTHNELAYTRQCVDSIRLRTDEPYELIFVDNGSSDGTVEYLRSLEHQPAHAGPSDRPNGDATRIERRVQVIANPDNRGFPAAANQGIRAAKGSKIVFLNNDTVVTTGWLRRMLAAFRSKPRAGLVGPCSNYCSGAQEVPPGYDRLESLDGFAWDWGRSHDGQTIVVDRLVGFCLVVSRELIDRIGLFDEQFGIGNYEDDDLCRRAIDAGYEPIIAADVFIHHFGSRTFFGAGVDFAGILAENKAKYDAKWGPRDGEQGPDRPGPGSNGKPQSELRIPNSAFPRFTLHRSPTGGLLLQRKTVRLSLCMIVRDNETTIGPCLASIRPWVDEIVVVDTGSTDRTPEICREHGARMFHFPWCDDFSAARNESLKHARGEWIFWMDSDDTISKECGEKLRVLANGSHSASIHGYVMQVHCPSPGLDGQADATIVDHVKLFRNRSDLRFDGRIHEQILPAIRHAGGDVAFTDIHVVHSGSDHSPETRRKKFERDFRILRLELAERPDHPFVLFNLGMTHGDAAEHEQAIHFLTRCIEVGHPGESQMRKAYALLAGSLLQLQRREEAWETCRRALELYPDDKELLFRRGIIEHELGRLEEAEATYRRVIETPESRHFASVDQGLTSYKARHNLVAVYDDLGRLDLAEEEWRVTLREFPEYRPAWRGLGELLLRQGKLDEAAELADVLQQKSVSSCDGSVLAAQVAAGRGDQPRARELLTRAIDEYPDDATPLLALCQSLFLFGSPAEAEQALHRLLARQPEDPCAHHNLGTIYMRQGAPEKAADSYSESLRLRPDSASTWTQYGFALRGTGREDEAIAAWQKGIELDSKNDLARQALEELEVAAATP